MRQNEFDIIENLCMEYHNIKSSREYKIGKKVIEIIEFLKKGRFISIVKKLITHKKMCKYISSKPSNHFIDNTPVVNKKIVVYTCIIGNYDTVYDPMYMNENCDYVLITDNMEVSSSKWKIMHVPDDVKNEFNNNFSLINRYYKLNAHSIFKEYDYAIYIDGNFQIVSDLTTLINNIDNRVGMAMHLHRERNCIYNEYHACKLLKKGNIKKLKMQIDKYNADGFPINYGMLECGLMVMDLKNEVCKNIYNQWWDEFKNSDSLRDQISLPYILWKNDVKIDKIGTLGNNCYNNPKYIILNHKKH